MDEEIELTTVDGRTVRVTKSAALWALGNAMQHDAYGATTRDGNGFEVRRVHAHEESTPETLKGEDREVPPEIEEDAADVAKAVDVAVRRVLDRRADALKNAIRVVTAESAKDDRDATHTRMAQAVRAIAAQDVPFGAVAERIVAAIEAAGNRWEASIARDRAALRMAAEAYFGGDFSKPDAPEPDLLDPATPESTIEAAAVELGLDPDDLRRRGAEFVRHLKSQRGAS